MGRATKTKKESLAQAEAEFQQNFTVRTREVRARLNEEVPFVSEDFEEYKGFFVRDEKSFVLRTKSKDRDKQRKEFVRHAFHLYPVPEFMFNAWERARPLQYFREYRNSFGFATREAYRLWYICIATGGSFYKEYGNHLFTKKECHYFLTCRHDIPIDQAIVYAIAYAECGNVGKSLRIAKSKINTFPLTPYWKDVLRFFARNEPESKDVIDDILDYIVYKCREEPAFTIIGKGHTLESLSNKVEDWHQDLRRLKLIGDNQWEGIPVADREYTQKTNNVLNVWKFTQIKSAKRLQVEGNAMRHCVLGYKNACIANQCSIWSMTFNDTKKLTIEVRDGNVVQVRGLANRPARPDERPLVWRWAKDSGFYYAKR